MNPSSSCALAIVEELCRHGVRDAVLAPGSRSAPLAHALAAADEAGLLRLHVRVDERAAAFLALGLAKRSRRPVPVVTTSGTAVANLHPAALEAHHAGVPLLLLTADRPVELRGTGASQTTRQPGIFGPVTRWSGDVGVDAGPDPDAVWRTTVARAVVAARGDLTDDPGPVHLDVPLRDPLVPDAPLLPTAGEPRVRIERQVAPGPARTLVVVGDLPTSRHVDEAIAWASGNGWHVVRELGPPGPTGVAHGLSVLAGLGRPGGDARTDPQMAVPEPPDRVILVGRATVSRAVGAVTRRPGTRVEAVTATPGWTDPAHVVTRVHPWSAIRRGASPRADDPAWTASWVEAGRVTAQRHAAVLEAADEPTGPAVARAVVAALPTGARLFVGSSNSARDLDLGVGEWPEDLDVVASRGLAGIDGCVSTAVGLALADPGRPWVALVGDLTFEHDAAALAIGPGEPRPDLTVVVLDDRGGGIFSTLEHGVGLDDAGRARFERVFATPTGTDLAAICAAHGVDHVRVTSLRALRGALADRVGATGTGLRVVTVAVDRDGHRGIRSALAGPTE